MLKQARAELVQAGKSGVYPHRRTLCRGRFCPPYFTGDVNPGQLLLSVYVFENMACRRVILPATCPEIKKQRPPRRFTFPTCQSLTLPQHQLFQFADPQVTVSHYGPTCQTGNPRLAYRHLVKLAMPLTTKPKLLILENAVLRQNELSAVYLAEKNGYVLRQVRLQTTMMAG